MTVRAISSQRCPGGYSGAPGSVRLDGRAKCPSCGRFIFAHPITGRLKAHNTVLRTDGTTGTPCKTRGTEEPCDGSSDCQAVRHIHGCFADDGNCDDPGEHMAPGLGKFLNKLAKQPEDAA